MRTRGFSLLELLVVLAIMGLVAALVAPRLGGGEISLLKADMRRAVAALNYARRTALIQGQVSTVVFSGPPASGQDDTSPLTTQSRQESTDYLRWNSHGALLHPKKDQPPQDSLVFHFYPEGGSNGGELWLSYAAHHAKITINPLTGKVGGEWVD